MAFFGYCSFEATAGLWASSYLVEYRGVDMETAATFTSLFYLGIGAAPVYPSIIHSTPAHFRKENSHAIVGIQMACAYCGSTFMPPLFGLIAQYIHIATYPYFIVVFVLLFLFMTERVNRICDDTKP